MGDEQEPEPDVADVLSQPEAEGEGQVLELEEKLAAANMERDKTLANQEKVKKLAFAVPLTMFFIFCYLVYNFEQIHEQRIQQANDKLQGALNQFPRTPLDYEARQDSGFASSSAWSRINFQSVGILVVSVFGIFTMIIWHRRRRTMLQKRRSTAFWAVTCIAGLMGTIWGVFTVQRIGSPGRDLVRRFRVDPVARGIILLTGTLLFSLLLYTCRIMVEARKHRKQAHLMRQSEKTKAVRQHTQVM